MSKWPKYLLIVAGILVAGVVLLPLAIINSTSRQMTHHQRLLLYHTNHTDLASACQFIHNNPTLFRPNPSWHLPSIDRPDPTDPHMPAIIGGLPIDTILNDVAHNQVRLELGGGFLHYGIEWNTTTPLTPTNGNKLLIPNLWYYSENGKIPEP